jgi:enterochelin esterase family protein
VIEVPELEPVASAWVDGAAVNFRFPDPGHRLAGVRLSQDVRIPGNLLDFHRAAAPDASDRAAAPDASDRAAAPDATDGAGGDWELTVARPPVTRMEYLFELRYPDGGAQTVTDPGNPGQVQGAFGPKSVLEFPSYRPPRWLTADAEPGQSASFEVPGGSLDGAIAVRTWAPAGARDEDELPLLVAHDGPEYDALAGLTGYLAAGVAGGWLPRLRAALLSPGPRDRWYSANPRYARALAREVIPALGGWLATSVRIGMGTSLGGLAMLHAHWRYPRVFDGLFLQSGSFFCPRFDDHERRFPYYPRVVRFVASVLDHGAAHHGAAHHGAAHHGAAHHGAAHHGAAHHGAAHHGAAHHGAACHAHRPVPVTMTCGAIEENVDNNRLMAQGLRAGGYPVAWHEVPDMHNYTAWRDAFDPYLTRLLRLVCG